ncbi:T-box [Necator americanus]|uniref:T-box n=1 Tax=Necator americanus TaxID=51031 RepID=W2T3J0_NECAM|nr:T-box [Necator americanus]ETN76468.1 T-box [Necator americanus]
MKPDEPYALMLRIERVDDMRYKFSAGEWSVNGKGELRTTARGIPHHDGAVDTGRAWMSKTVSFDRVKVTNNLQDNDPFHSMHKYVPVLYIYHMPSSIMWMDQNTPALDPSCLVAALRFDFTEFIAVTAYQNNEVTQLKISHNPFAKGFREGSERDRKRTSISPSCSEPSPKRISPMTSEMKQKYEGTPSGSNPFLFPWAASGDPNRPRSYEQFPTMQWYNYYQNSLYSPFPYYYPYMPNCYPATAPECAP